MTTRHLSPEIVSLIHHVELNESGWWKKAIGQVITGVLWKTRTPQKLDELKQALKREVGIVIADDVLLKQLTVLQSQQTVIFTAGPSYKLTEQARQRLSEAHDTALAEQEQCRATFINSCGKNCAGLDAQKVWEHFQKVLIRAIHITGANLYHLLEDGNLEREGDWLTGFLTHFNAAEHNGLRNVLAAFFSPRNSSCRKQVLRLMTAHFFAEASQLRPETLASIEKKRTQRIIKVVLDTNFIFSVLQLHDNPGDDSALSLVDIAQRTRKGLEVKLYVLPGTLDEARRTLTHQMHLVDRIRTTAAMARAAVRQPLPSIAKKFFAAAAHCPGLLAQSFFQPYIDDLRTILHDKGIEVLDAHPAIYNQRQDVVDDVLEELRREEQEIPEPRRKSYETHLHDIVLWHAIRDRRPINADSPFEVEYWAVSIDWRLISFDRRKHGSNSSHLPIVLHPSNLLQFVQFWVPRTQELEDSLIDSLRLPLFFQSFDPADERATIQVLEAISRFENIADMAEETVCTILANRALRGRLREADASNDEVLELVREELLLEHKTTLASLDQTKENLALLTTSLETEQQDRQNSETTLNLMLVDAKGAAETAQKSLWRLIFLLVFIIAPGIIGILTGIAAYFLCSAIAPEISAIATWAAVLAAGLSPLAAACVIAPYFMKKHSSLQNWSPSKIVSFIGKRAILAPITLAVGAIFQGGVWDLVKTLSGWQP